MAIELSQDMRQMIDATGTPLEMVDPRTGSVYFLVRQEALARLQTLIEDDLIDTYPAQIESAMRAGWDDPVMDEYNDYDRNRPA
jgi:hypothetical protein